MPADAPSADATTPVPRPDPILDAPAPPPVDPTPPITLGPSPIERGPGGGTPAPVRPPPPAPVSPADAPAAGDRAAGETATPTPAPAPAPVEAVPAPRAAATIEFEDVGLMTIAGSDMEEHEVLLRFESDRLVLFDEDSESAVRTVPYRSLADATYARSKSPVGKAERDRSTLVRGLSKAGGLFRRTPHWLTLEGAGAPITLKVDGGDVERVISTIEARTSAKVARVSEK